MNKRSLENLIYIIENEKKVVVRHSKPDRQEIIDSFDFILKVLNNELKKEKK